MSEDEEETTTAPKANRVALLAGLSLLAAAGLLYWLSRRPCHCGEAQVDEVAQASAEVAATNGTGHLRAKKPKSEEARDDA